MKRIIMLATAIFLLAAGAVSAGQQIGQVVAIKGKATITRGSDRIDARVKSAIELQDTVKTGAASRAKLLFRDETVLTLGEESSISISEFVHSRTDRGKSLFNLLDGKMRAVVGKNVFEVKTPTAVAAARGTVIFFETGVLSGRHYTKIISLEGVVEVRGLVAGESGVVELKPGMMIIIMEGERIGAPEPASTGEIERARRDTALTGSEITLDPPKLPGTVPGEPPSVHPSIIVPPMEQQVPPLQPRSVNK